MPTYTVKNTKTNETYNVFCKYSELQELLKVDGVEQVLSTPLIVTGVGSLLSKTDDGFKDRLKEIKIINPISSELGVLRNSIYSNLIMFMSKNLFMISNVFRVI